MAEAAQRMRATGQDRAIIALIGVAHFTSHTMQMALPPLLPLLHELFGVSFTALGLAVTCFYVASGTGQTVAGVLVDRYGAVRLLAAGIALVSGGILLAGLAPSYWLLLPLAFLAGLGNSVFHPADLSILSHRVNERLLGRAYAVHVVAGQLGYAAAPVFVGAVAAVAGWRMALVALGACGLAVACLIFARRRLLDYARQVPARPAPDAAPRRPGYLAVIGSPIILMAFAYFTLTAFGGTCIQAFSVSALAEGYAFPLKLATLGVTAYLVAGACGSLAGGFLADRTEAHDRVAMAGVSVAALPLFAIAGLGGLPAPALLPLMVVAGFAFGLTGPSRDKLVRRAASGAGMGSVFGFVYSGFDLGSSTAPLAMGALLDGHATHAAFAVMGGAFLLAVPSVMQLRRGGIAAGAAAE